jgi:outer membrane protein OmpA-like peptidoglycan-associated protein
MVYRFALWTSVLLLIATCGSSSIRDAGNATGLDPAKIAEEAARKALAELNNPGGPLAQATLTGFAPGKADLKPGYFRAWFEKHRNSIISAVQSLPQGSMLVVTGHSDPLGGEALAESLAIRRAQYVAQELLRLGVTPDRLTTRSMGSRELANPHFPGAGENRRVTFSTSTGGSLTGDAMAAARSVLPGAATADVSIINAELQKLTVSGFSSGKSTLRRSYENQWMSSMGALVPQVRSALSGGYVLEVAGHSDPFGGYEKARKFAASRASYIAGKLRALGIPGRSIRIVNKAADELANTNFVGAAENRRVTLKLVAGYGAGAPSGGLPYSNYSNYGTGPGY